MTDQDLVRLITQEVIKRLAKMDGLSKIKSSQVTAGTLVLIPSYVADETALKSYLKSTCQEPVTCALWGNAVLNDTDFTQIKVQSDADEIKLMASLSKYSEIVLATPPIGLLKKIASADDSGFIEQLVMRAILWEKKVSCVLDYMMPRFKRNTIFEVICDTLDALKEMGVKVVSVAPDTHKETDALALVTETEVLDTHKNGGTSIRMLSGAIVTPLAKDRAKELNISIVKEQGV